MQGDFLDTYHNLSYKAAMGNLWVAEFCSQAQFVVKTDDDMYVDLYEVHTLTRRHLTTTQYLEDRYIGEGSLKKSKFVPPPTFRRKTIV